MSYIKPCTECQGTNGGHYKTCSRYGNPQAARADSTETPEQVSRRLHAEVHRAQAQADSTEPRPLTTDEHKVLREAVRDSAELVAPGRLVDSTDQAEISDEQLRAGIRVFQSGHNGFDDLSDWRAFANYILALQAPRQAPLTLEQISALSDKHQKLDGMPAFIALVRDVEAGGILPASEKP
jgi:hypothetical protein